MQRMGTFALQLEAHAGAPWDPRSIQPHVLLNHRKHEPPVPVLSGESAGTGGFYFTYMNSLMHCTRVP